MEENVLERLASQVSMD